jgi:hypothetical protein
MPGKHTLSARLLLAGAMVGGCASPTSDVNLAPLYLRATAPEWQTVEAFGGLARFREDGSNITWALSPLIWKEKDEDGKTRADYLAMLGRYEYSPDRDRTAIRLLPLLWYEGEVRPDGVYDSDWLLLPFFAGGSSSDGEEDYFAFFPFFGKFKNWLMYDEVRFFLFPLWARTKKSNGTVSSHFLWPFFGYQSGHGQGWNFWPFYGTYEVPGLLRRNYVLWPFFNHADEYLNKPQPRHSWFLFPIYGRTEQGDSVATTFLWPFISRAERPSTDYYNWSLWPLIKFEEGGLDDSGRPNPRKVHRVLPFYMHFEDKQSDFTSWLFPIFWRRHDEFGKMERDSWYAVPLWWRLKTKRFDDLDGDGLPDQTSVETITRFWPFLGVKNTVETDGTRPEHHIEMPYFSEAVSRNFTRPLAFWQEHQYRKDGPKIERALLGLYYSIRSGGHHRWSIPILGGQWTEPDGTRHHSYLLGLLRWQSGGPEAGMQAPAFPGPGWPDLHRMRRHEIESEAALEHDGNP